MDGAWTAIPNTVACDESLSCSARMLYVVMSTYARRFQGRMTVWPSNETLAKHLGKSQSTVKRAIKELKEKGLITRESRGQGKTTLTHISEGSPVVPLEGSPVVPRRRCIEEEKDPAPQKTVREVTVTRDEGDLPPEMSPPGNRLRSKKKSKVNHSLAREVYEPLKGMWEKEAVALGYEPLDDKQERDILPLVVKARKATGGRESPLNDPEMILAGLRKRAEKRDGFWLDAFKFRMLFLSKAGLWYCRQLAHEGQLDDRYEIPIETLKEE